jgi:hypothetical protein
MRASKSTVTIKLEVLSKDAIRSLLSTMLEKYENEVTRGELSYDDGDLVSWDTNTETLYL